jgi:hypothetical protein
VTPSTVTTTSEPLLYGTLITIQDFPAWTRTPSDSSFLLHALPVSGRESMIIGALFFVGAAILFFIRPDDKTP